MLSFKVVRFKLKNAFKGNKEKEGNEECVGLKCENTIARYDGGLAMATYFSMHQKPMQEK